MDILEGWGAGAAQRFSKYSRAWPFVMLLAAVVLFHRQVLFFANDTFPWDFRGYNFPQAWLMLRGISSGEWPLWNPYIYCGHPFAANVQAEVFYPPRIASVALAAIVGSRHLLAILEWELVLHVYIGGILAYICGRRFGLKREAALLTAVVFALGGYFASQAEHIGAIETAAWVPGIVAGLISWKEETSHRSFLEVSGALSMAMLAGFTPLLVVVYSAFPAFLLVLIILRRGLVPTALRLVAVLAASWLLSAIILLPAAELTRLSVAQFRADWRGTGGGIPPVALLSLVWPNLHHVLEPGKYTGRWEMTFMYLYSGILGLGFATVACFRQRTPVVGALLLLLGLAGIGMLGDCTPIGRQAYLLLPSPIQGTLYPQHWMVLFDLTLALLSGFGLQYFALRKGLAAAIAGLAAVELIAVSSGRPFNTTSVTMDHGVTTDSFEGSGELLTRVRQASASEYPPSRLDTYGDSINWVESAAVTEIPTAGGYDPLALVRYMQVRLAFASGDRWGAYYQAEILDSPMLSSLDVRYLLSRQPIPPEKLRQGHFRLIGELPGHNWYENQEALPRFYFVKRALPAASLDQALSIVRSPSWRPSETAVIEAPRSAVPRLGGTGFVQVLAYRLNSIDLRTTTSSRSLLASSEVHYPGWRAFVDGHEVPIYFCNAAFRGIIVAGGTHRIQFRFQPSTVIGGGLISMVAWLIWGVTFVRTRSAAPQGMRRH